MDFNMEWNVICRICLQEGEMKSIYDEDEKGTTICEKISRCSNLVIKRDLNLPKQICLKCLNDLEVALRFRENCESSDAILQSFLEGNVIADLVISSDTGETYKYKPPQGLNVRRIRPVVKIEPMSDDNKADQFFTIISHQTGDDGEQNFELEETTENCSHEEEIDEEIIVPDSSEKEARSARSRHKSQGMIDKENKKDKSNKASEEGSVVKINKNRPKPLKKNITRDASIPESKVENNTDKSVKVDSATGRRTTDPKPLKICEICGNTYKYKHALDSHMRRHRNEKPFSCEICGRAFVINFELRRHMRIHTGQKPYACKFCERRFSDFGSRIKHERTHTGERPYTCETCGKSFAYSHVLTSHILTHTGEKRYSCSECGKRFAKSHHLKAHLNTHLKYQNKGVENSNREDSKIVLYESDNKSYQEVLATFATQPKIEPFEDEIKVIYTTSTSDEDGHRHSILQT